ncbi:MAG: S1 RNA-binding domain-containing protein [Candidatus Zambryskibacteria bacterium]|nr:S1 RNA-binding domain-containing protein [Candidatus Zambryskibacteria bacterium]
MIRKVNPSTGSGQGILEQADLMEIKNVGGMEKVLNESKNPPSVDEVIEGTVLSIEKAKVYIDIPPFGTGIIYGREYINARDIIKKINVGDTVAGKVISISNKDGYIEISLKEARQALIWNEAEGAIAEKKIFELPVQEANKGGLMLVWQGITGFLPASQLKTEHYPRVSDGDKDKILEELRKLVGQKISVAIIGASPKEGKLIFSEKNPEQKNKEYIIDKYVLGDVVTGEVTGMVDFGVFVKLEEGLEGLVHISEIDWALVENPKLMFHVGQKVKVKIIEIKDGKISLSIKALKENPWNDAEKKYKKDAIVEGVIIKFNKHGALASIEEGIAGLVHISEFGSDEKLHDTLELGKSYTFKITLFDAKEQRMTLSYVPK